MRLGRWYLALFASTATLFFQFIACGSQMYKASLTGDTEDPNHKDKSSALGVHSVAGWKTLPIRFKVGIDLTETQKAELLAAISTWEGAVGKKLFSFEGVQTDTTGDKFPDLYSSLTDMINGNYNDKNWEKTKKPREVLATTIWTQDPDDVDAILTSDIRYNTEYYTIGDSLVDHPDSGKEIVDMQSLALHELGHLLGLSHVTENEDSNSVMKPTLFIGEALTTRRLSRGDIERIQSIYKCEGAPCNIDEYYKNLEYNQGNNLVDNPSAH